MNDLEEVVSYLTGDFSNKKQFEQLSEDQKEKFPYAVHRNHILTPKIEGIPKNFEGVFLHEESYYTLNNRERFKTDIFLFSFNEEQRVKLSAVTIPKKYDNKKFDDIEFIAYNELSVSEKFVPIVYEKIDDAYIGKSESMITASNRFFLTQKISSKSLVIKEEIFKEDRRIFGFDKAIVYERN
ncbi:hypothetical protein [Candidatus Enterococcus ferrettii]|uniref:Uncharacterized protein n=1 Tax=Candidatus Enterococcus ferrettii TaxID=2815324 RepID=A0ABV0EN96_9ENTE|nr:hypothetical protein [Enterococcus sp. 665A]MBO1340933.1 hypothetical protein [Enterococcus sp. 665A]